MTSLLLINSDVEDINVLISSIKSEHKYLIYKDNEIKIDDVLKLFDNNTKYLTFIYHFPGYYEVPFFRNRKAQNKYRNFSNDLINLFQKCKEKNGELTVDFLSCNINNKEFYSEAKKIEIELGINIRYSVNATGNKDGDWILESDKSDIKAFYFNDNIENWNHILTGEITTTQLVKLYPLYFKKKGFTTALVQNVNSKSIGIISTNNFIVLESYEIFDGGNFTITYDADIVNKGSFSSINVKTSDTSPLIVNLIIQSNGGIVDGGGFVRNNQMFFIVQKCISNGTISGINDGGICGYNAGWSGGSAQILNCSSTGNISGTDAGGISGSFGGINGNLVVKNCFSTGNIIGDEAGGIVGSSLANTGNATVEGCYSTGNITGNSAGGITGTSCCNIGNASIIKCFSLGNISGLYAGGICGSYAGNYATLLDISGCYSNGLISGSNSGGIVGQYAGYNGILNINNCYDCFTS